MIILSRNLEGTTSFRIFVSQKPSKNDPYRLLYDTLPVMHHRNIAGSEHPSHPHRPEQRIRTAR